MTDVLTPAQRSRCMSRIRSKNTRPEKQVRSALHSLGFRYRLHSAKLPGRPDMVFPKAKVAIFIHGCFWHMHSCRFGKVVPKTNGLFWQTKRKGNVERDKRNAAAMRKLGWKAITVWECECRESTKFQAGIRKIVSLLPKK
jgi:DNA mismatch endonuclease (patch repair protein)